MRDLIQCKRLTSQPTISSLLATRAVQQPSRIAYTFISGDGDKEQITYAELDQRARAIGCQLNELGAHGKPVALLYPPGIDYLAALFGTMYAGSIAIPVYLSDPLQLDRSLAHTAAVLRDASPFITLTTPTPDNTVLFLLEYAHLPHGPVLAADNALTCQSLAWEPAPASPESIALLHYSCGFTSAPKGAILTHRNLMDNSELIHRFFGHSEESRGMLWLPPHHGMGLIGGILQPLYGGFPMTLMTPSFFMQHPVRWLQEISRMRATTSGAPNFAYDLCVQTTTAEERRELDLSSWQVAFNACEPVHSETMERFAHAFGPAGFRPEAFHPCYGSAEGAPIVTGGVPWSARQAKSVMSQPGPANARAPRVSPRSVVSCGRTAPGHRLAIVDPSARLELAPGQIGEIWLSGPGIAQACWRGQPETAEFAGAWLADTGEGPFLPSGDLGFVLGDQIFVTGRHQDLIVSGGTSHYLRDIELTAELGASALRPGRGAAFAVTVAGEQQLVVAYEVKHAAPAVNAGQVIDAIRAAVAAEHGIPVHTVVLVSPDGIPRTASGQVQRSLCTTLFEDGQLPLLGDSLLRLAPDRLEAPVLLSAPGGVHPADEPCSRWYRWLNGTRARAEQVGRPGNAPLYVL
jgi:acyl-CoA synthetase (AMP-forming)/AMP-acid ligase II